MNKAARIFAAAADLWAPNAPKGDPMNPAEASETRRVADCLRRTLAAIEAGDDAPELLIRRDGCRRRIKILIADLRRWGTSIRIGPCLVSPAEYLSVAAELERETAQLFE